MSENKVNKVNSLISESVSKDYQVNVLCLNIWSGLNLGSVYFSSIGMTRYGIWLYSNSFVGACVRMGLN